VSYDGAATTIADLRKRNEEAAPLEPGRAHGRSQRFQVLCHVKGYPNDEVNLPITWDKGLLSLFLNLKGKSL
jgi:hypothetical protein